MPDKDTKIGKDAMGVVGKYFETFVREAIARAAYERQMVNEEREKRGERIRAGEEFLEVSLFFFEGVGWLSWWMLAGRCRGLGVEGHAGWLGL